MIKDIQCLKAELSRKDELLVVAKERVMFWDQALQQLHHNIDTQFKSRLDSCTNVLLSAENNNNPANQSFDQPPSLDNSVILIDSKTY